MNNRIRNLFFWIGAIVISLILLALLFSSSGFGAGFYLRYFPFVAKDYPPTPTPVTPTPVGPVGGTFTALVVDPNQSQTILAGSYVSGVYKTYDQGDTWYQQNAGLGNLKIQSLAYHPYNSNIVYAGTYEGGIYKSINGGNSWTASNGGVLGNQIIYDIEIDPNNADVIYVATRINGSLKGYLYKSTNSGASWSLLITGEAFSKLDYFYDIDVNPLKSNELYLTAHEHGFYKSTNAGVSFTAINSGVSDLSARSFALDSAYPGLVYGAVWHDDAVFRTWNSGASWSKSRVGLPTNAAIFRLYADPFGGTQKRVFACSYGNGLYSTDNFAQNWSSRGLAGQRLYDFIVANGYPQRWFAATESNGVFRTNADSNSWSSIMGDLRLNAITATLKDDSTGQVYTAVYGKGVYALDSSGTVWEELTQQLADKAVIDLVTSQGKLHVLTESSLYVLEGESWVWIDLPIAEGGKDLSDLTLLSGRMGLSAESLSLHFDQNQKKSISENKDIQIVVPLEIFSVNGDLYVGTVKNGLYMRVDNEWKQFGLEGQSIIDITSGDEAGEFYVIACQSEASCQIYRFSNGAWVALLNNSETQQANRLLYTSNGLLAATNSGLFLLDPSTEEWALIAGEGKTLLSITTSDNFDLAAAGQGFVLHSHDCGKTWQEILLDDWHYQTLGFLGDQNEWLLLGAQEAGAAIIPLH